MKIDIDRLTERELRFLAQMRAHDSMLRFSIGQRVAFDPNAGPAITGTLIKYNKKTVTVIADDGRRWNVSPGLLRQAEPKDITPDSAGGSALDAPNRRPER